MRGSYALIPGSTPHNFENRENQRCGFISVNVPGGFELAMSRIVEWLAANPLGDIGTWQSSELTRRANRMSMAMGETNSTQQPENLAGLPATRHS